MPKFFCIALFVVALASLQASAQQAGASQAPAPAQAAQVEQRTVQFFFDRDLLFMEEQTTEYLAGLTAAGIFDGPGMKYTLGSGHTTRQLYVYCRWDSGSWGHYYDLEKMYRNRIADYLNRRFKIVRRTGVADGLYENVDVWYMPVTAAAQIWFTRGYISAEDFRVEGSPEGRTIAHGEAGADYLILRDDRVYGPDKFTLLRVDSDGAKEIKMKRPLYNQGDAIRFALWDQMREAITNSVPFQPAP